MGVCYKYLSTLLFKKDFFFIIKFWSKQNPLSLSAKSFGYSSYSLSLILDYLFSRETLTKFLFISNGEQFSLLC